jgi:hypothetical protein
LRHGCLAVLSLALRLCLWGQLRRSDPILWSDAVTLFEDELGDNGSSQYSVKVVRRVLLPRALWLTGHLPSPGPRSPSSSQCFALTILPQLQRLSHARCCGEPHVGAPSSVCGGR